MTQFKIEFLLAFTGCRKVLGKMPDIYIYIYIYYWLTNPCYYSYVVLRQTNNKLRMTSVKLQWNHTDDHYDLNFNQHISNTCKSASKQLNALVRLKCFLGFEESKVLIVLSYHILIIALFVLYQQAMSLVKAENLKKRALRFLHNDYTSLYELSLKNSRKPKISVCTYRTEISKAQ